MHGWRYRFIGIVGVILISGAANLFVQIPAVEALAGSLPVLERLSADPEETAESILGVVTTILVFLIAFIPLYKPRPRHALDSIALAEKRVVFSLFTLATIGYFDYTYRLPRLNLILMTPLVCIALPSLFVWIRHRPAAQDNRAVVVGDESDKIREVSKKVTIPLLGFLAPLNSIEEQTSIHLIELLSTDRGTAERELTKLGGLSKLADILIEYDVDTVILAFEHADRKEFFGVLDSCYQHGVSAKVHSDHVGDILTQGPPENGLIDVEFEPWDIQDYIIKRGFDIVFALVGIAILIPVMCMICVAINLDDGGPIFHKQERSAILGDTFTMYKFRSMVPAEGSPIPVDDEGNTRITTVGQYLRQTHLDEIPQLWSILIGKMSVVGPRAVWTDEEQLLCDEVRSWRKRWFIKPGLTGLAQINHASSTDAKKKLQLDLKYVREQSLWLDIKIIARQTCMVFDDVFNISNEEGVE